MYLFSVGVKVVPLSVETITAYCPTATNLSLPKAIEYKLADVFEFPLKSSVQLVPLSDLITVPLSPTAMNLLLPYAIPYSCLSSTIS